MAAFIPQSPSNPHYPVPFGAKVLFEHKTYEGKWDSHDNKPSLEILLPDGRIWQYWHYQGKLSRKMKPSVFEFDLNGVCIGEYWYQNNLLHRDATGDNASPQPAVHTYCWDSIANIAVTTIGYYRHGVKQRTDGGPAEIITKLTPYEHIIEEYHYNSGKLHNRTGPAVKATRNGEIVELGFYISGVQHNDGAPSHYKKTYNWDGVSKFTATESREWRICGVLTRAGAPAISDATGDYYYSDGNLHNDSGPAFVHSACKHIDTFMKLPGYTIVREWRINGKLYREGGFAREYADGRIENH